MTRTMYDGITASRLPTSAQLVAGYVDGLYAWSAADWARFPNGVKVRIACFASTDDGVVLDCEPGNCTPAQSVDWVLMRRRAGVDPTVYCNELDPVAGWPAVRAAFRARGVPEPHYWVANYSVNQGSPQIPAGAVALQYADKGAYDLSVVADYWPGVDPAPVHTNIQEIIMQDAIFYVADGPEKGAIYVRLSDGQYGGVGTIANRDALVSLLGVQEKQISGSLHSVFLALAAKPGITLTDAQAEVIGAAIAAKLPTTLTLTGTETVTETGKLS